MFDSYDPLLQHSYTLCLMLWLFPGTKPANDAVQLRKRNNRLVAAGPRGGFDYEKHLTEQLALDRERLEFEKTRFKKEVELREKELSLMEKRIEQERTLLEKEKEANLQKAQLETAKFMRVVEVLRETIVANGGNAASVTAITGDSVV